MSDRYEVEVKSLLGSKKNSDLLLSKLAQADKNFTLVDEQEQLNHYFIGEPKATFYLELKNLIGATKTNKIRLLLKSSAVVSVRTRQKNNEVFIILKATEAGGSAAHDHKRIEIEYKVDISIEELDNLLKESGLVLQAKWSASRKMYRFRGLIIDMMFSPGYGYIVELEKVVGNPGEAEISRKEILSVMKEFDIIELKPARLEKMFKYYNDHWQEYYGTNKVFKVN